MLRIYFNYSKSKCYKTRSCSWSIHILIYEPALWGPPNNYVYAQVWSSEKECMGKGKIWYNVNQFNWSPQAWKCLNYNHLLSAWYCSKSSVKVVQVTLPYLKCRCDGFEVFNIWLWGRVYIYHPSFLFSVGCLLSSYENPSRFDNFTNLKDFFF